MVAPLISVALLAELAEINESAMPDTATIHNRVAASSSGRPARGWTLGPALATVACRMEQPTPGTPQAADAPAGTSAGAYLVTMPRGTAVGTGQLVKVTAAFDGAVRTLEVTGLGRESYAVGQRVWANEAVL